MKVRISFAVDVDDNFRRALNAYYGKEGLASREDIKQWYAQNAASSDDDMLAEFESNGGSDED